MKKDKIYNICVLWLVIDQMIKMLVTMKLKLYQKIILVPNFFKIYYVKNDGAAFSSFAGMRYLLIIISIVMFFLLYRYISKNKITNKFSIISLGMILGGLVGNLVDRLLYGSVIDYISFSLFNYSFAVFNFADIGIVIGVIILLIQLIRGEENGKRK